MQKLRENVSRLKALGRTILGSGGGFFIQYDFVASVKAPAFYPAFAAKCQGIDLQPVLRELDTPAIREDPFFRETTDHLGTLDALVDYAMVRWAKPYKIIEIGSGRSTHILNRAVADNGIGAITCIDPAPRLDVNGLPVTLMKRVASVEDVKLVAQLQAGDILFIDSSHILQPGTDCDIEFNMMFPALAPGVIVHVHDIFLPYGYPADWAHRNWNEACGFAPWVLSDAFEVLFPTCHAARTRADELYLSMPDFATRGDYAGGSFWVRKR